MQLTANDIFPARPSSAQRRFEQRYAKILKELRGYNLSWEVGSVESAEGEWPALALHLRGFAQQWRPVLIRHAHAGELGQLVLISEGIVSDESGTPFSQVDLLIWVNRQLAAATARMVREHELTLLRLARNRKQARLLLIGFKVLLALVTPLAGWAGLTAFRHVHQPDYWQWGMSAWAGLSLCWGAGVGYWWIGRWLRQLRASELLPD